MGNKAVYQRGPCYKKRHQYKIGVLKKKQKQKREKEIRLNLKHTRIIAARKEVERIKKNIEVIKWPEYIGIVEIVRKCFI